MKNLTDLIKLLTEYIERVRNPNLVYTFGGVDILTINTPSYETSFKLTEFKK